MTRTRADETPGASLAIVHDHAESAAVGLVIVNYNGGELIQHALDCLRRQTRPPQRTIVVDNASTDGSGDVLAERFAEVELVRTGRNLGFAGASNLGVSRAQDCELVALLNPDAFPEPRWLEQLVAAAGAEPQSTFFTSRLVMADGSGRLDGTGDVLHVSGLAWRRDQGESANGSDAAGPPEEVFGACAAAALYHRSSFLAMGGFDDSYFAYIEDVDLSFRLRLAGHRCLYVPTSVVHHVGSATTGHESDFTVYLSHRNFLWTWLKNMPWPLVALYLPQHLFVSVLRLVWFSARGQRHAILRAQRDALRALPRVLRQRRAIQSSRQIDAVQVRDSLSTGRGAYTSALRQAVRMLRQRR